MPKRTQSYSSWQLGKLTNPETAAAYLSTAISDSPEMFRKALRTVFRARQVAKVAREAGVQRETLYRATSEIGNPTLDTLDSVLEVMGLGLAVVPREKAGDSAILPQTPVGAARAPRPISVAIEPPKPDICRGHSTVAELKDITGNVLATGGIVNLVGISNAVPYLINALQRKQRDEKLWLPTPKVQPNPQLPLYLKEQPILPSVTPTTCNMSQASGT